VDLAKDPNSGGPLARFTNPKLKLDKALVSGMVLATGDLVVLSAAGCQPAASRIWCCKKIQWDNYGSDFAS